MPYKLGERVDILDIDCLECAGLFLITLFCPWLDIKKYCHIILIVPELLAGTNNLSNILIVWKSGGSLMSE